MVKGRAALARGLMLAFVVFAAALSSACMGEEEVSADKPAGEATPADEATTTAEAAPEEVLPPENFSANPKPFSITLSWSAPTDGAEVEEYVIYRGGADLAHVDGSETSYSDVAAQPGRDYVYEIEAHAGELVATGVSLRATTPTPPLRAARLAGYFDVRTKELSASGYQEHVRPSFGWQMRPRCSEGPCDVRWRDIQRRRIGTVLNRRGASYRGTYTGFFNTLCGSARTTSVVEVRFKVTAARAIGGEWRATRFRGTLSQSEAEQLGCVASSARLEIRGRLSP